MAEIAQRWADNCVFDHDDERRIPGRFSVGQNLAAGYSDWDTAIQGWYGEIDDFTYGDESAVGHYKKLTIKLAKFSK